MAARLGLEIEKHLKCKCIILDFDTMTEYSYANTYFSKPFEEFIEEMKDEYKKYPKLMKVINDIKELHDDISK